MGWNMRGYYTKEYGIGQGCVGLSVLHSHLISPPPSPSYYTATFCYTMVLDMERRYMLWLLLCTHHTQYVSIVQHVVTHLGHHNTFVYNEMTLVTPFEDVYCDRLLAYSIEMVLQVGTRLAYDKDVNGGHMQRYKDYSPTQFDSKGAFLHGENEGAGGDWFVAPVIRTRDSEPLEESNFHSALEMLGGEGENVEVHRFGHWGPGWYEIILIRPETSQETISIGIEESLEDYPILDEDDFSTREWESAQETWENCYNIAERVEMCRKNGVSIFAARHNEMPGDCFDDCTQ